MEFARLDLDNRAGTEPGMPGSTNAESERRYMDGSYLQIIEDFLVSVSFTRAMITAYELELPGVVTEEVKQRMDSEIAHTLRLTDMLFVQQLRTLFSDTRWEILAQRQPDLNRSLNRVLKFIRLFIRARYGQKAHHPPTQLVRDFRIMILKVDGHSFSEIAERLGISVRAVWGSYERQLERAHQMPRGFTEDLSNRRIHSQVCLRT